MRLRSDFIRGLARRLPGVDGFAPAAAAVGDPAPLLERQAAQTRSPQVTRRRSRDLRA
jgi:hypothetical protein